MSQWYINKVLNISPKSQLVKTKYTHYQHKCASATSTLKLGDKLHMISIHLRNLRDRRRRPSITWSIL